MTAAADAPAKVNLRLVVHEPEPSGFHPIETLFCALELADRLELELTSGDDVVLDLDGPSLGPPQQNLAVRAARAFLEGATTRAGVRIRLVKRIPAGGGLGGGSSDAAAVLRLLNEALPGEVTPAALREMARSLGSDVPFFLQGRPFARGTGRGDVLEPAAALPSRPVVLAIPPFGVSTAAAYGWIDDDRAAGIAAPPAGPPSAVSGIPADWGAAAAAARNDFEGPVFRRHPELAAITAGFREAGATVALLSGSGSTVFGVFSDDDEAAGTCDVIRDRVPGLRCVVTRTAAAAGSGGLGRL